MELVISPDVERLVIDALDADLVEAIGVRSHTRVPKPRPMQFVRVLLTGGQRETIVSDAATVSLEAWADTEPGAVAIIHRARAVLFAQDGDLFGVFSISLPANLPDPTTSQTRYTSTVGVRVRGTVTA